MDKELEQKLALLSAKYGKELPEQLQKICDLWDALRENWSDEIFVEFSQQIHTLSGSAGMFGFDREGDIARQIQMIYTARANQRSLSDEDIHKIDHLIKFLK